MDQKYLALWQRKPKSIIVSWLILSILFAFFGFLIGSKTILPGPATKSVLMGNPGEQAAYLANLPPRDTLLITISSNLDVKSDRFISARTTLVSTLHSLKSGKLFPRVQTLGNSLLDDNVFVSKDQKHLLIIAESSAPIDQAANEFKELPKVLNDWQSNYPDFELNYISQGTASNEMFDLINSDLDYSLIYSLPVSLLILILAFRSIVAALIPLFMAIISLAAALGIASILSQIWPISVTAAQLIVLLVIAIGVDYSLFIISRLREEVEKGHSYPEAIRVTRSTTGIAVLWSGLTVAISLTGLLLMADSVLSSMAVVSIVAVMITVISCVFVLPSLLLILGNKIELGNIPKIKCFSTKFRFLNYSIKHPLISFLLSALFLCIIAYFSFFMKLGTTVEANLLPSQLNSSKTYSVFEEHFPDLAGSDMTLILRAPNLVDLEENGALDNLFSELREYENLKGPFNIEKSSDETIVRYHFTALGSANLKVNQDLIHDLRNKLIPRYINSQNIKADLSGTLAYVVDEMDRYASRSFLVLFIVLSFSFIFLLIAFRSIVVPIKALLLNILSTAAAFGVLVIVFQYSGFKIWNYGVIESFVPPLLFSILFGLSMDYHVFLLSRINEEVLKGSSTADAVRFGIEKSSKTISSAALIMVSVFLIIASLELPIMKELGIGLAVAVFIDASLIRNILLPSSMLLLGEKNWYFPKFLRFLPKIKLE